jgi:hypothetical protein
MEVIRLWEKRKDFRGSNEVLFRLDDLENRKHEKRYDRCVAYRKAIELILSTAERFILSLSKDYK